MKIDTADLTNNYKRLLMFAGFVLLVIAFFLPWSHWQVDDSALADKFSQIDPSVTEQLASGSTSPADILAKYGDMGPDSTLDDASLLSLVKEKPVSRRTLVPLAFLGAMLASLVAFWPDYRRGKTEIKSVKAAIITMLGAAAVLIMAMFISWIAIGGSIIDWWARHPARDVATSQWRLDAINTGYFQLNSSPGYGRWIAIAALVLLLAPAVLSMREVVSSSPPGKSPGSSKND